MILDEKVYKKKYYKMNREMVEEWKGQRPCFRLRFTGWSTSHPTCMVKRVEKKVKWRKSLRFDSWRLLEPCSRSVWAKSKREKNFCVCLTSKSESAIRSRRSSVERLFTSKWIFSCFTLRLTQNNLPFLPFLLSSSFTSYHTVSSSSTREKERERERLSLFHPNIKCHPSYQIQQVTLN